jgi:hypothetical protein
MATKKCEACDAEIGESEKECPKCGVNFEELEVAVKTVTTAQAVAEKRRKAADPNCDKCGKPKHEGACAPKPAPKKKTIGFGNVFGKRG